MNTNLPTSTQYPCRFQPSTSRYCTCSWSHTRCSSRVRPGEAWIPKRRLAWVTANGVRSPIGLLEMHTKEPRLPAKLTLDGDTPCSTPVHNHGEQQADITVHKAKVSLKKKAATSGHGTKFLVASTVAGLDFKCRAKLNYTPNQWRNFGLGCPLETPFKMAPPRKSSQTYTLSHTLSFLECFSRILCVNTSILKWF